MRGSCFRRKVFFLLQLTRFFFRRLNFSAFGQLSEIAQALSQWGHALRSIIAFIINITSIVNEAFKLNDCESNLCCVMSVPPFFQKVNIMSNCRVEGESSNTKDSMKVYP